jgi:tetratricopeptide (TPR) repeat protein/tRNA A-37 threonylcarbamoyl transferase component Bud32
VTDLSGSPLGKYQLQARLGRGGMAEVYRAYQPGLERMVAIKILHPHLAETPDFLSRFKREAQAVAQLHHPHIVQVHDFEIEGDRHYMVMEHIAGQTLKARLDELFTAGERMPLPEVASLFRVLLDAVGYAHAHQITHRDLKPANVLLEPGGRAVLTDFGIAKIIGGERLTGTGVTVGTPAYMSPEQGQGDSGDPRSDIYALGIMLYECLTGQVPFEGETSVTIMLKHISAPIPALRDARPDLSPALEAVVTKALAKDPNDRFQTTAEMWTALAATLDESEARAVSATRPTAEREPPASDPAAPGTRPLAVRWPTLLIRALPRSRAITAALIGLGVLVTVAILASAALAPRLLAQQAETRGQSLLAEGKYQLAADAFSAALQNDPRNVDALLGRAAAYEALSPVDVDVIEKALADVDQVVTLAPQNAAGYRERARLGLLFGQTSDMRTALADVDRAVALAPQSARAHFVRGWAILNFPLVDDAPNPSAALPDLQKAVALDGGNAEAQLTLAQTLLAAGHPNEALASANRAAELDSGSAQPFMLRAYIQFKLSDYVGAADDLSKAIRLATDPVQQGTLLTERGYLHYQLGTPSEARDDLQEALSKDPNNLLARYLPLLLQPALPRPAASQIEKVQAEAPDDPIWQALTGELLSAP